MNAGVEVPIVWRGRRVTAFVPQLLAERDLTVDTATLRRLAAAEAEIGLSAEALPDDVEPLARLLLRAEGAASSYIEGISAPAADVAVAAVVGGEGPAAWVAANRRALDEVLAAVDAQRELTMDLLCEWHRTLMAGAPLPDRYVGALRTEQGWIGGTDPTNAALVTPPPDDVAGLLDDLLVYANRTDLDGLAQTAAVHAQFELIHPFADGNGRLGRLLISWLLARRLALVVPPPVSLRLAADRSGYLAGLTLFRLGDHNQWMRWFASAAAAAAARQRQLPDQVEALKSEWRGQLAGRAPSRALRRDAAVWRTLDLMPRHSVLTSELVAGQLGVSHQTALTALHRLRAVGVVEVRTSHQPRPGRPVQYFVSPEMLGLL